MKALTVHQGWAEAIISGVKDIENRSWSTPYRGTLYIHAGKSRSSLSQSKARFKTLDLEFPDPDSLWFGAIGGTVELVDCVENHPSQWAIKGQYHWVLENPARLDSLIYCPGQMSLWTIPETLLYRASA